jgi:6-pyruvoyl-tetrahydropterin synthase
MYSVTVCRHVMIAHSLRGEVFGPAQGLHGATLTVEAEFRRAALDGDGLVCDIGRASETLEAAISAHAYRNLDDLPEFAGQNTTTEVLAGWIFRRLQRAVAEGALGPRTAGALSGLKVVVRESPLAWAAFEGGL